MTLWYRVFGTNEQRPDPADLLRHLHTLGIALEGQLRGDDQGWFLAELTLSGAEEPVVLNRYLTTEEGMRSELNSWAAWLETTGPEGIPLMQQMISTQQLFTFPRPTGAWEPGVLDAWCEGVCRYLADASTGIYQVDGQGFFDADGALLVEESA